MIGIYKIQNTINGKVYIGQSKDIEKRFEQHKKAFNRYNFALYRAFKKYGLENFTFEVLEECEIDELDELESKYIKEYNSFIQDKNSHGYNMTSGGDGVRVKELSEEHKRKISVSISNVDRSYRKDIIIYDGKEYDYVSLSDELHVNESTIRSWLKGYTSTPKYIYDKGLSFKDKSSYCECSKEHDYVICDNKVFKTVKECSKYYNVNYRSMCSWLNGQVTMPDEYISKGLSYLGKNKQYYIDVKNRKISNRKKSNFKRVYCITNDTYYDSIKEMQDKLHISHVSDILRGKRNNNTGYEFKCCE